MPELYPVGLVVAGRSCLVVGGGPVAARKAAGLLHCGARVTIVAAELGPDAAALAGCASIERRGYIHGEAGRYQLVFTATDCASTNQAVFADAEAAGVWVNSADDPQRCSFLLPAISRHGDVVVAVSTGGASPALAGWLRNRLADALPARLEDLVALARCARSRVRRRGYSTEGHDWLGLIDQLSALLAGGRCADAARAAYEFSAAASGQDGFGPVEEVAAVERFSSRPQ